MTEKIKLCTNWWGGLGDCILYLSAANAYCKRNNTTLNIGCCNDNIERKSLELLDVFKNYNDILFNFILRKDFIKDGNEDIDKYEIFGNDNYIRSVREVCYVPKRQIYGTYSILRVNGKICDIPDFEVPYLKFKNKNIKNYITIQLDGRSSGGLNNYYLNNSDFEELFKSISEYKVYIISSEKNNIFSEYKNVELINPENLKILDIFNLVNDAKYHIGTDSGICHVAMSCLTPYIGIKKKTIINGLVNGFEDPCIPACENVEQIIDYILGGRK